MIKANKILKMGFIDRVKNMFQKEDEFQEETLGCDKCGVEYPHSMMTASGVQMFCTDCLELHKKEEAEREIQRKKAKANQKMKYFCYDCKFHFSRKKEFYIRICPNCGGENFVEENRLI